MLQGTFIDIDIDRRAGHAYEVGVSVCMRPVQSSPRACMRCSVHTQRAVGMRMEASVLCRPYAAAWTGHRVMLPGPTTTCQPVGVACL